MTEPVPAPLGDERVGQGSSRPSLSVCCLTHGRSPIRLTAILRLLRPVADEIVVALDDRARESASMLAGVADRILLFSHAEPGDRPIVWLCSECRGDWIFNIDDDEIPSATLLLELPLLVGRRDVTHCWVARRWLYPDVTTYLDEPPWNNEYQLRLFQADDRFLRFTDQFHRPVACGGPMRFVEAPLWHLDTALGSRSERERKALRYERVRRGMRIGALSHNTGIYLPELRGNPAIQPVPPGELTSIERILRADAPGGGRTPIEEPAPWAVDREWPGEPHPGSLYESAITLLTHRPRFVAAVQQTIDVRIENLGDCVWRFGDDSITIGTRWDESNEGIRTSLPADVKPGESAVVPVHVIPPVESTRGATDARPVAHADAGTRSPRAGCAGVARPGGRPARPSRRPCPAARDRSMRAGDRRPVAAGGPSESPLTGGLRATPGRASTMRPSEKPTIRCAAPAVEERF